MSAGNPPNDADVLLAYLATLSAIERSKVIREQREPVIWDLCDGLAAEGQVREALALLGCRLGTYEASALALDLQLRTATDRTAPYFAVIREAIVTACPPSFPKLRS